MLHLLSKSGRGACGQLHAAARLTTPNFKTALRHPGKGGYEMPPHLRRQLRPVALRLVVQGDNQPILQKCTNDRSGDNAAELLNGAQDA